MSIGNEKGVVLVMVFIFVISAAIVTWAFFTLINTDLKNTAYQKNDLEALYIARAGIERALVSLEADFKTGGDGDWTNNTTGFTENFDVGNYTITFSNQTKTTIVIQSQGMVGTSPFQVTRTIKVKARRLPEAFNYALFWERGSGGSILTVQGTVEINGGDFYARGNVDGGILNVPNDGVVSATRGGFVYSSGEVTADGAYSVGTAPNNEPGMPTLDTAYYNNIMIDFDGDIANYQGSDYLGYTGSWENDPNGTVNITLSGTLYFRKFTARGASTITGSGAIVADGNVKLEGTTDVNPDAGGTIIIIAKNRMELKNSTTVRANTNLYSKNGELKIKDGVNVSSSALLSSNMVNIADGTVSGSILYVPPSGDKIEVWGSGTKISAGTLLSGAKIEVKNGATVDSESILYLSPSGDKIEVKGDNTSVDGIILSGNKFKLNNKGTVTGIVFASEAELIDGTIYGSVIVDSFTTDRIGEANSTVTINYNHIDYGYLPEAPPGLGGRVGDSIGVSAIVLVPNTWEEL